VSECVGIKTLINAVIELTPFNEGFQEVWTSDSRDRFLLVLMVLALLSINIDIGSTGRTVVLAGRSKHANSCSKD